MNQERAGSSEDVRIAYFTESLYPHVDGVSRTLGRLFDTLEHRREEFLVFSPFVPDEGVRWSGRVRRVRSVRLPGRPEYRLSLPGFTRGVERALSDFAPDLVHVVSPTPMAVWAQRRARALGVPVVASFHTHFVSYFRYYGARALEPGGWAVLRWFYRRCARVYAPSRTIADELAAHGIRHVEIWSRGIDLDRYSPAHRDEALRRAIGAGSDVPLVLLVSRLVKEKDLADLVAAERILRDRGVVFRLALVGDGPMRLELESALPDAVFAGHLSGAALSRYYASADVFVFPSTTETLGNVVLEALASGLPAVVVDRGGPRDLVDDGRTGYIARPNDPADLADRVERLVRDAELRARLGAAARASAVDRDWSVINGGLLESYGSVVRSFGRSIP